jgi:hypothetical protein
VICIIPLSRHTHTIPAVPVLSICSAMTILVVYRDYSLLPALVPLVKSCFKTQRIAGTTSALTASLWLVQSCPSTCSLNQWRNWHSCQIFVAWGSRLCSKCFQHTSHHAILTLDSRCCCSQYQLCNCSVELSQSFIQKTVPPSNLEPSSLLYFIYCKLCLTSMCSTTSTGCVPLHQFEGYVS